MPTNKQISEHASACAKYLAEIAIEFAKKDTSKGDEIDIKNNLDVILEALAKIKD